MVKSGKFFEGKKSWSETKDALLGNYLTPFFTKVYKASRDGIVYIDAFAGQGLFGDGTVGSPLIAIDKYLAVSRGRKTKRPIQFIFGEADGQRRRLLKSCSVERSGRARYIKRPIVVSSFGEAMERGSHVSVVGARKPSTYFCYVDPFGVKHLRLEPLLRSPNPSHTEVLVNFNSVGFIREACEAMRVALNMSIDDDAMDECFDSSIQTTERIQRLSAAIGSDGWKSVVKDFRDGGLGYWEAEYRIGKLFCQNARRGYKYVTNMPVKDMSRMSDSGGEVKYRLVHMTNNPDGCILMNDEMIRRRQDRQDVIPGLLSLDIDRRDVEPETVCKVVVNTVLSHPVNVPFPMREVAANVISECGVFMRSNALLREYLSPLIEQGLVERVEKYTSKTHKPKTCFGSDTMVFRSPSYQQSINFE